MTLSPPAPPPARSEKRRYVRDMFSAIAPRYDLLNHLLSLGVDRSWRRHAVDRLLWEGRAAGRGVYLDACAGTLDLGVELARRPRFGGRVVATDFATPMLRLGTQAGKPARGRVSATAADTLALPFPDSSFDGVMVGFGVRNLEDLDAGLRELWRVLKPGARLVVLDFTTPSWAPLRALYLFYFHRVLPLVGRVVSGHPTAYSYLPASVEAFPAPVALLARMRAVGFRADDGGAGFELLTGGIAAIHWGTR